MNNTSSSRVAARLVQAQDQQRKYEKEIHEKNLEILNLKSDLETLNDVLNRREDEIDQLTSKINDNNNNGINNNLAASYGSESLSSSIGTDRSKLRNQLVELHWKNELYGVELQEQETRNEIYEVSNQESFELFSNAFVELGRQEGDEVASERLKHRINTLLFQLRITQSMQVRKLRKQVAELTKQMNSTVSTSGSALSSSLAIEENNNTTGSEITTTKNSHEQIQIQQQQQQEKEREEEEKRRATLEKEKQEEEERQQAILVQEIEQQVEEKMKSKFLAEKQKLDKTISDLKRSLKEATTTSNDLKQQLQLATEDSKKWEEETRKVKTQHRLLQHQHKELQKQNQEFVTAEKERTSNKRRSSSATPSTPPQQKVSSTSGANNNKSPSASSSGSPSRSTSNNSEQQEQKRSSSNSTDNNNSKQQQLQQELAFSEKSRLDLATKLTETQNQLQDLLQSQQNNTQQQENLVLIHETEKNALKDEISRLQLQVKEFEGIVETLQHEDEARYHSKQEEAEVAQLKDEQHRREISELQTLCDDLQTQVAESKVRTSELERKLALAVSQQQQQNQNTSTNSISATTSGGLRMLPEPIVATKVQKTASSSSNAEYRLLSSLSDATKIYFSHSFDLYQHYLKRITDAFGHQCHLEVLTSRKTSSNKPNNNHGAEHQHGKEAEEETKNATNIKVIDELKSELLEAHHFQSQLENRNREDAEEYQHQLSILNGELSNLSQENQDLSARLEHETKQKKQLKNTIHELEERILDNESFVSQTRMKVDEDEVAFQKEIERLKRNHVEELLEREQQFDKMQSVLVKRNEALQTELAAALRKNGEYQEKEEEETRRKSSKNEDEEKSVLLRDSLAKAHEKEKMQLEQQIKTLQHDKQTVLEEKENQLKTLQNKHDLLISSLEHREKSLQIARDTISKLEAEKEEERQQRQARSLEMMMAQEEEAEDPFHHHRTTTVADQLEALQKQHQEELTVSRGRTRDLEKEMEILTQEKNREKEILEGELSDKKRLVKEKDLNIQNLESRLVAAMQEVKQFQQTRNNNNNDDNQNSVEMVEQLQELKKKMQQQQQQNTINSPLSYHRINSSNNSSMNHHKDNNNNDDDNDNDQLEIENGKLQSKVIRLELTCRELEERNKKLMMKSNGEKSTSSNDSIMLLKTSSLRLHFDHTFQVFLDYENRKLDHFLVTLKNTEISRQKHENFEFQKQLETLRRELEQKYERRLETQLLRHEAEKEELRSEFTRSNTGDSNLISSNMMMSPERIELIAELRNRVSEAERALRVMRAANEEERS